MNKLILSFLLLSAVLVGLTGCTDDDNIPTEPTNHIETFQVGLDGGTYVTSDSLLYLTINAYIFDSTFTLSIAHQNSYPQNPGVVPASCYWLDFGAAEELPYAQLTLHYADDQLPEGIEESTLQIHVVAGDGWLPMSSTVDPVTNIVTASVYSVAGSASFALIGHGGNILVGDYNVKSTNEIADLAGYEGITGNLEITLSDSLSDLSALDSLKWIGGYLAIVGSSDAVYTFGNGFFSLEAIDLYLYLDVPGMTTAAFPALTAVGGHLQIEGRDLQSLAFPSLTSILGSLRLQHADSLADLSCFETLTYIGGSLKVMDCDRLRDLRGLENVRNRLIGIEIAQNNSLLWLHGIDGIHLLRDDLRIADNPSLLDLSGTCLCEARGITIVRCKLLTSINGLLTFESTSLEYGLYLQDLPSLESLYGLQSTVLNGATVNISMCDILRSLDGINAPSECHHLVLFNNPSLTDISALHTIQKVSGVLFINDNNALTDIDSLYHLTSIGSDLRITGNEHLTNLDGLSGVGYVGVGPQGGDIFISSNTQLTDLTGLHNLQTNPNTGFVITGEVHIDNNAMGNAAAWEFIEAIGGEEAVRDTIIIESN